MAVRGGEASGIFTDPLADEINDGKNGSGKNDRHRHRRGRSPEL